MHGLGLNSTSSPGRALLFFSVAWALLGGYWYGASIAELPIGHHAWAMSDYYAMALQFKAHSFDLFHPRTFNLQTPDGITASDLPLPAWSGAILMALFRTDSPLIFRLLTWCVSWLGLVFFFRSLCDAGVMPRRAAVISLLMGCLPAWLYYHAGTMPSPWALCAFSGGIWALGRVPAEPSDRQLRYAGYMVLGFTLAALLRKPFVLYLAVLGWWIWRKHPANRRIWSLWGAGLLVFGLWQLYDRYLGAYYGSIFLRAFMPAGSLAEMRDLIVSDWQKWGLVWFSPFHMAWLALLAVVGAVSVRKRATGSGLWAGRGLWLPFAGLAAGYFLLMLRQFADHEYYALDSFYPALLVAVIAGASAGRQVKWIFIVECLLLLGVFWWGKRTLHWYGTLSYPPATKTNRVYLHSRPLLDALHLPADARIMVFEGYSDNLPLIGLGHTGYSLKSSSAGEQQKFLARQPDYATCLDTFFVTEVVNDYPDIVHRLAYVGGTADLLVFRPDSLPGQNLEQLLGTSAEILVDTTLTSGEEFLCSCSRPALPGRKVLLYGEISLDQPGPVKATVALFQNGNKVALVEKNLPVNRGNTLIFRSTDLLIPAVAADEMRIYLWNPEHRKVDFQHFKISVIQPRNRD